MKNPLFKLTTASIPQPSAVKLVVNFEVSNAAHGIFHPESCRELFATCKILNKLERTATLGQFFLRPGPPAQIDIKYLIRQYELCTGQRACRGPPHLHLASQLLIYTS